MHEKKKADLIIFVKWMDFLTWLFSATEKFPRKCRHTMTNRIVNLALDTAEDIVEARYSRDKSALLRRMNIQIEKLRILLRISHTQGYLPNRSYEYSALILDEAGRMLGGWIRQKAGIS